MSRWGEVTEGIRVCVLISPDVKLQNSSDFSAHIRSSKYRFITFLPQSKKIRFTELKHALNLSVHRRLRKNINTPIIGSSREIEAFVS